MSTTISKGRMFRITVSVDDARLKAMRRAPELAQQALAAGAEYWHSGILPRHFEIGASAKYGYAPRGSKYLKDRKKQGKPPLVYSGSMRRDLKKFSAIKSGSSNVELRMSARVLNFAPAMPQQSSDLFVKHKSGHGYPNTKREIKLITEEEREAVATVVAADLARSLDPSQSNQGE